tara:strand:- start:10118 stop:12097 length:1980 start_codon:yes stop_codon:yes gene_type:complete
MRVEPLPARSLVVFCPLPPKQNGIADYLAEQLPYHCRDYAVTAVIANADPKPIGIPAAVTVIRLEQYLANYPRYASLPHIYHVGNNVDHGYMLPVLYQRPGVVVVHDLGLHHLIDTQTLVRGDAKGYAWALWQHYGRAGKRLGEQFLEHGWKGQAMPHELRLNGGIIAAAERIIVHSHYSAHRIRAEHPDKPVTTIPHHLSPCIARYNRARRNEAKIELGLPLDRPVLTSMGFITRPKQAEAILQALCQLKAKGLAFRYVLAGQYRPEEYDVKADIARFGLQDDVEITGYLDESAFFTHLVATDLILNLRYPCGGETSGTQTRALGMGRCCMLVNIGPFAEIPDDCAVKLNWDEHFAANLQEQLLRLMSDKQVRAGYETRCRDWISSTHGIQTTTRAYHAQIDALQPDPHAAPHAESALMKTPGMSASLFPVALTIEHWMQHEAPLLNEALKAGCGMLWWRQGLVPFGENLSLHLHASPQASGVIGRILTRLLNYDPQRILPLPTTGSNQAPSRVDRLLAVQPLNALAEDPVLSLTQLNARLNLAAEMVLSITNLESGATGHPRMLSPANWTLALECAGFQIIAQHAAPADITYSDFVQHSPELSFRVKKISERIERYPASIYPEQENRWTTLRGVITDQQTAAAPVDIATPKLEAETL